MYQRPTIICIMGRTCTGKDTLANILTNKCNIPQIVSYTTRPKRDSEEDGREHIFITEQEWQEKYKEKHLLGKTLAYTEINEYRYFTLIDQLQDFCIPKTLHNDGISYDPFIYVIDYDGYNKLASMDINLITIYLKADKEIRRERFLSRNPSDNAEKIFNDRNASENDQFYELDNNLSECDFVIDTGKIDVRKLGIVLFG